VNARRGVNGLHHGVPVRKPTYLINLKQVYPKTGLAKNLEWISKLIKGVLYYGSW
jgi:hypothetical protein